MSSCCSHHHDLPCASFSDNSYEPGSTRPPSRVDFVVVGIAEDGPYVNVGRRDKTWKINFNSRQVGENQLDWKLRSVTSYLILC